MINKCLKLKSKIFNKINRTVNFLLKNNILQNIATFGHIQNYHYVTVKAFLILL